MRQKVSQFVRVLTISRSLHFAHVQEKQQKHQIHLKIGSIFFHYIGNYS